MARRSPKPKPQKVKPAPVRDDSDVSRGVAAYAEPSRELLATWVTLAILAVAVLVVYVRALNAPFIFDDTPSIKENPSLVQLWPLVGDDEHPGPLNPPKNLPTAGRPLANLTLAINYHYGELNPLGYHIFNLIVHVLAAALLAAIVRRTLELDYFDGRFDRAALPLSILVALMWALHPLQTESVIYVTQRTELLVGFFYLATLYCSIRYWSEESNNGRRKWLILATLACLCGMASKEVMVTAPLVVALLYERAFVSGSFSAALRRSWRLYAGLAVGWLLLLWLNVGAPRGGSAGFHHGMDAHVWWFTQAKVLWIYLKLVVWPWPLIIQYGMPYLDTLGVAWPWLLPTALLGAITAILLWRNTGAGFLLACLWLILSPTLIVPILTEVAAERRMYLPLAALVSLVVVGGFLLLTRLGRTAVAVGGVVTVAVMLLFAKVSFARLGDYLDEVSLWREAVARQPNDPVLRNSFSETLINHGLAEEALKQAEMAVRLRWDYAQAHKNLGEALYLSGRGDEAATHFKTAIQLKPNYQEPYNNLGVMLVGSGQLPEAINYFERALQLKPDDYMARTNLANAQFSLGRTSDAIANFQKVLERRPDFPSAHNSLAFALFSSGQVIGAIHHFQEAVRLKPDFVAARDNLGVALLSVNRNLEALGHFQEVIRRQPDDVSAWNNLAKTRARLDQFPQAVEAAEKALALAQAQGRTEHAKKLEAALEAYRSGREPTETAAAAPTPDTKPVDVPPATK